MMDYRNSQASALIIAPAGRLRDSLRVLLRASNHVTLAGQADDTLSGLRMIVDSPPTMVLLDANVPGAGVGQIVQQVKTSWPRLPCIVLAHTLNQERQARQAGADRVLQAGLSAEAFFNTVEEVARMAMEQGEIL